MITLYKLASLLNSELEKNDLKTVPTQMMYNYARQNLIATIVVDGKKLVNEDVAQQFINKFVAKRLQNA